MSANIFYKRMIVAIVLFSMLIPSCGGPQYVPPTPGVYPPELTQPLPTPREISNGLELDQAAETLAEEVITEGESSLPALITAFRGSGIAIRGEDGGLASEPPVAPWQGVIYEAWELPMLTNFYTAQSTPTITLMDLSQTLTEVIPELQGASVAKLILEDIRTYAKAEEDSPKRFWALFLVELGRQSQAHEPYDLLDEALDPATVQLDGLQASLILRQLAFDLAIFAGPPPTSMNFDTSTSSFSLLAVQPADAGSNLPCTMNSTEKSIMDWAAFGYKVGIRGLSVPFGDGEIGWKGLIKWLKDNGVKGAEQFKMLTDYTSILLAWSKFINTYVLLKADITIDSEPLIRTKHTTGPGEGRHRLTAVVKMDTGNFQLYNCFRIMLNSVGLDYTLPQDGALKNVRTEWHGLQGFEGWSHGGGLHHGIVQFVGGDPLHHQFTNSQGMVHIDVEGTPQKKEMPKDAIQVPKQAGVDLTVAVQSSDLFKDISGIIKSNPTSPKMLLTLPTEILSRVPWATAANFTFEVIDWTETEWNGTITYSFDFEDRWEDRWVDGSTVHSEEVTITLTKGVASEWGNGIRIDGTAEQTTTLSDVGHGHHQVIYATCGEYSEIIDTEDKYWSMSEKGSGEGTYPFTIYILPDGSYVLDITGIEITTSIEHSAIRVVSTNRCEINPYHGDPGYVDKREIHSPEFGLGISGSLDINNPTRIYGKDATSNTLVEWELTRSP